MKILVNDISLFTRIEGTGYPILIMHGGLGADHTTMLSLLPLAKHYQLIFYDHRANGRSTGSVESITWKNLTADAEALRMHLHIKQWAVLGHSFGGFIALEYVLRYPDSISHLILLDSGGDPQNQNADYELNKRGCSARTIKTARRFYHGDIKQNAFLKSMLILGKQYYSHPSILLLVKEAINGLRIRINPSACIHGFKTLLSGWSVMAQVDRIKAPTLIVAGKDDFLFPPHHQALLASRIKGSKLVIVEAPGHLAHVEKPSLVIGIIKGFIDQNRYRNG